MAVKHKGKRKSLQKRAVEEGWSAERTAAAVRGEIAGGVLASGGRPLARPTDVRDALRQVGRHGGEWLRRCGVWSAIDTLIRAKLPAGGEPSLVRAEMAETRSVLREVSRASLELEAILRRVERTAASGAAAIRPGGGAMRTGDRRKER